MAANEDSGRGSPAEEPVEWDLVPAEDASIVAERRGLRRQRLASFEPAVGEEHLGVGRRGVHLDACWSRGSARADAACLAPEAGTLADAVAEVEDRPSGRGDGVGAVALHEAPGTVLPVARGARLGQRRGPALLGILSKRVGARVVDDARGGLEVDGEAPVRGGGGVAVEDGAFKASLGEVRGEVSEGTPAGKSGWFSRESRVDCPPLVSRGSGFGGIGVRQGTFGRVAGVGLTCIQETQLLPAEVTFFPPVYEVPGRKSAPSCEPPRAPRAFPRDHVSQKQLSGERGCAARAPMARHRSSTIRGKVILDELPGESVEPRFRARWCGGRRGR